MDRFRRRVAVRIREWRLVEHDGRRLVTRGLGHNERLDVEATEESLLAIPGSVGLDVTLIPGEAKGRCGKLDHEEVEFRICRQPTDLHIHLLDGPEWRDRDRGRRAWQARSCPG